MEPGVGYKLYLAGASQTPGDDSFGYPEYQPTPPLMLTAEDRSIKPEPAPDPEVSMENSPSWNINANEYQFNMTVTAILQIDGVESIDEGDLLGAFVGGQCRGLANPVYVTGLKRYEMFLMIHSNETAGEEISLKAFDASAGRVLDVEQVLTWQADANIGTVLEQLVLNTTALEDNEVPDVPTAFALMQNVPNPFNPSTTIRFDLPEPVNVKLVIYNVRGELVTTLINRHMTEGRKSATWDARDSQGTSVASGVYFYRIIAGDFVQTKKMVLLR
jgi:hypothetical protein